MSRRKFFDLAASAAGGALAAGRRPAAQSGPRGANDRVRMALIGSGGRGRGVAATFVRNHTDVQYVAACDAYRMRLDQGVQQLTELQKNVKVERYEDYRRILDRTDIDAVLIATPDHWHCQILIDAMAAGKDAYVEKPLSNSVERAVQALRAYKGSNRVVQIGTQQRSGQHFQEAATIVHEGQLGRVTHAVLQFAGSGYGTAAEPVASVPEGLNWDLFQGPAPRHPFKHARLRWRGWWDYGGGLITDWGVHLTDVALWYLNAQRIGPLLTSGTAQYVNFVNPERDQSPDAFSVSWQYPEFVMTFTNAVVHDWEFGRHGNYFFGPAGSLLVHRGGYEVRPGPPVPGGRGAAAQGRGATGRTEEAPQPPVFQPRRVPWRERDGESDSATRAHARNFLDCTKSRQKPVSDLEIGFYASLPTLLAVMAIREGRSFKWDDGAKKAVRV
jgi:predicted dehydrogenase